MNEEIILPPEFLLFKSEQDDFEVSMKPVPEDASSFETFFLVTKESLTP